MGRLILAAVMAVALAGGTASAGPVVMDQSYNASTNLGGALAEGFAFAGQGVTAGIAGSLVRVEIDVVGFRSDIPPWVLDIQEIVNGSVTGNILSSVTVAPENFRSSWYAPWQTFDLSTPVFFQAGDQFAIVLHPQGLLGIPGLYAGSWAGNVGIQYTGGTAFYGYTSNSLNSQTGYDLHFRTWVDPTTSVPEPATLTLLGVAAAGLGLLRRRR